MARTVKPETTETDLEADVAELVASGMPEDQARAMSPEDRSAAVAALPEAEPEPGVEPVPEPEALPDADRDDAPTDDQPEEDPAPLIPLDEAEPERIETEFGTDHRPAPPPSDFAAGTVHQMGLAMEEFVSKARDAACYIDGGIEAIVGSVSDRLRA